MEDIFLKILITAFSLFLGGIGLIIIGGTISSIASSIKEKKNKRFIDPESEKDKEIKELHRQNSSLRLDIERYKNDHQTTFAGYIRQSDEIKDLKKQLQKTSREYYKENEKYFQADFEEKHKEQISLIQTLNEEIHRLKEENEKLSVSLHASEQYASDLHGSLAKVLEDHLKSFPYLAGMIADYLLIDDYTFNNYHGRSVKLNERKLRIDTLLKEKKELIARSKEIQYQLDYILTLFPELNDILDSEYKEIPLTFDYTDHDPIKDYLSTEEYKLNFPITKHPRQRESA